MGALDIFAFAGNKSGSELLSYCWINSREIRMSIISKITIATVAAFAIGGGAFAMQHIPVMQGDTSMGKVLVDMNEMTLYTFDKDTVGVSNCYDTCAEKWPPLFADDDDVAEGDYTMIERKDGTKMWAYKGAPLYLWVGDSEPGDVSGDGVGGVWHVIKPAM